MWCNLHRFVGDNFLKKVYEVYKLWRHKRPFTVQVLMARNVVRRKLSSLLNGTNVRECVALDCEMVGTGPKGSVAIVGRVAVVDHRGDVRMDSIVKPTAPITDYRTFVTGLRPKDFDSENAISFSLAKNTVQDLVRGNLLVGHALKHDLEVLHMEHPPDDIRDTLEFCFSTFSKQEKTKMSLKKLAAQHLGISIQNKVHSPIDDARAAMALYQMYKEEWEAYLNSSRSNSKEHQ